MTHSGPSLNASYYRYDVVKRRVAFGLRVNFIIKNYIFVLPSCIFRVLSCDLL